MSTTPEPWTVQDNGRTRYVMARDGDGDLCALALVVPHVGADLDANARLITAAPRLLRWLEKAAQLAEQQAHGGDDAPLPSAWAWFAEHAREAIASTRDEDEVEHYSDGEGHDVWIG